MRLIRRPLVPDHFDACTFSGKIERTHFRPGMRAALLKEAHMASVIRYFQ